MLDGEHDYDLDGLNNKIEQNIGTFPHVADTDDDGVSDYNESVDGTIRLTALTADQVNKARKLMATMYSIFRKSVTSSDMIGLTHWTIEAWVSRKSLTAFKRQVILRRTVGRYAAGDAVNYEIGLTEEGLPYAGFTVVKDNQMAQAT